MSGRGLALAGFAALAFVTGAPARTAHAAAQVEARLEAASIPAGSAVGLIVTVTNPSGGTGDPSFNLPPGVSLLGSDRSQSFSWVNGRSTTVVTFRYQLGADTPGAYHIGPIRVRVGSTDFLSASLPLRVTSAPSPSPSGSSGGGGAPAWLVVDVRPQRPYVGQLVQLSMKLVQVSGIADSRGFSPPATPGFWSESWGDPTDYSARAGGRAAEVTERRARLYPLAPGTATIGPAALIVVASSVAVDPIFGGTVPVGRPVEIRSESLRVAVRPLPAGSPAGFENAVGDFEVSWGLDRGHTAQDQAVTLRLDVRGTGNLPLLHTPELSLPDFEVFASTVDDSFAPSGEIEPGRRRFQWTLLPRRSGTLELEPPAFAWFDPGPATYRQASLRPILLEVLSAAPGAATSADDDFPREFAREPASPGSRAALPWAFALAGALLGVAIGFARAAGGADRLSGERARQREFLRAVGLAHGPDFWRAADEAAAWAESRGERVAVLRHDISVARYGGTGAGEDDVRRRLVERVSVCVPPEPQRTPRVLLALSLATVALALAGYGAPRPGSGPLAARARVADAQAREHQLGTAAAEWRRLWEEGGPSAPLAARLAWAALSRQSTGEAAAWVLRGRAAGARSGALAWATERVREAGGLVGADAGSWPVRPLEWGALALALALAATLLWPRRWSAAALLALALAAAFAPVLQSAALRRTPLAVVESQTPLSGAGIDLDPGQVVRIVRREGTNVRVRAGRGVEGTLPAGAIHAVWGSAP